MRVQDRRGLSAVLDGLGAGTAAAQAGAHVVILVFGTAGLLPLCTLPETPHEH